MKGVKWNECSASYYILICSDCLVFRDTGHTWKEMNVDEFAVGNKGFGTLFVFLLIAGEVYTTFTFWEGAAGLIHMGQQPIMYRHISV